MMLRRFPANTLYRLLAIPLVLWAAWQIGIYAGRSGITYVEVIIGALTIAGIIIMGKGHAGIRFGYFVWILTLALGYRTILIGQYLRLHPLVLLISALLIILVINKVMENRSTIRIFIPRWLGAFVPFLIWGLLNALLNRLNAEIALINLISIGLIIPVIIVTYNVIVTERDWLRAVQLFYLAGVIIAAIGLLEYFSPTIRNVLPGLIAGSSLGTDQFSFTRASFSFFGHPVATLICALALMFVMFLYTKAATSSNRFALLLGAALLIGAIYIGGYRSIWLTLLIVFTAVFMLRRDFIRVIILLVAFTTIYIVTPQSAHDRLSSIISAAEGNFVDSSAVKRSARINDVIHKIINNPLGIGLSSSGWAHSDILQITADTGWIGGLIFSLWFLHSLYRIMRIFLQRRDTLDESLLASMFVVMSILIFQTVTVLPQLSAPIWFVWSLIEVRLERLRIAETAQQVQPSAALPMPVSRPYHLV